MRPALAIALACAAFSCIGTAQQRVTINYATRTGTTWPFYIAQEGGYFSQYGLQANLVFGVHPAGVAMVVSGEALLTNYPLEQAMQAAVKDGSLVMTIDTTMDGAGNTVWAKRTAVLAFDHAGKAKVVKSTIKYGSESD